MIIHTVVNRCHVLPIQTLHAGLLHGWYFVFRCLVLVLVLVLVSFVWLAFLLRLPGLPRGPQHPTQWRLEQPAMNLAAHAQHVHFPIQRQMAQREARQFFLTKFKSQQITFARFHSPPSDQLTDTFSDLLTLHKDHCLFSLVTLLAHIELSTRKGRSSSPLHNAPQQLRGASNGAAEAFERQQHYPHDSAHQRYNDQQGHGDYHQQPLPPCAPFGRWLVLCLPICWLLLSTRLACCCCAGFQGPTQLVRLRHASYCSQPGMPSQDIAVDE